MNDKYLISRIYKECIDVPFIRVVIDDKSIASHTDIQTHNFDNQTMVGNETKITTL